jgi:formate--tetrahydrofolate ligase
LNKENVEAIVAGFANLERHVDNIRKFGVPVVVAINRFAVDSKAELAAIVEGCRRLDVPAALCNHFVEGGAGALDLADAVISEIDKGSANFHTLYPDSMPPLRKIEAIAFQIYHAGEVTLSKQATDRLAEIEKLGLGHLPVCIAKTQYSNSADPSAYGAPTGHILPVREVRLCSGAEFIVAVCGEIMTMPGLPRVPAAESVSVDKHGRVIGIS